MKSFSVYPSCHAEIVMNLLLKSMVLSALGVAAMMLHLNTREHERAKKARQLRRKKPRKPRIWHNAYLGRRSEFGFYTTLLKELRIENPNKF